MSLHHVQIAAPPGSEDVLCDFYGALGFIEVAETGAPRGPRWLLFTRGGAELHVGIEESFVPARKAHPAFDVGADLDAVASLVVETGAAVTWADREEWAGSQLAGLRRLHTHDPVGIRVALVGR
jgi:catechol 2,3-dioxygenase-like lactoylglutathione lyase family enzyme